MNKRSILITVLALSLVLLGTGYAYWTDTLNVTTKATTGDMEVKFVDLGAYAQYGNEYDEGDWSIIDGIDEDGFVGADFFERGTGTYNDVFGNPDQRDEYYDRAEGWNSVEMDAKLEDSGLPLGQNYPGLPYGSATNAGDTISIELENLYPGYAQAFRSDIINIGSIAVKLAKVDFELKSASNDDIKDLIGVALLVQDENPETYGEIVKLADNFDSDEIFSLGGVNFVRLSALDTLTDEDFEQIAENFILVPTAGKEHRADLYIGVAVDPDAEGMITTGSVEAGNPNNNDDAATQNRNILLDIEFGWDQFNAGKEIDSTNILENQNQAGQ